MQEFLEFSPRQSAMDNEKMLISRNQGIEVFNSSYMTGQSTVRSNYVMEPICQNSQAMKFTQIDTAV